MHSPSLQLLRAMRTSLTPASSRPLIPAHTAFLRPAPFPSLAPAPVHGYLNNSSSKLSYSNGGSNPGGSGSGSSSSHASRPSRIVHRAQPPKPQNHDRGPPSTEKTQTDFAELDVFGNIPAPATAIDACLDDGFHLDNGMKITGGDGVLLVGGEAFRWRPWEAFRRDDDSGGAVKKHQTNMVNEKGQFEVPEEVWGLLGLVWPRPGGFFLLFSTTFPLFPFSGLSLEKVCFRGVYMHLFTSDAYGAFMTVRSVGPLSNLTDA
jgi:hypothetical protein